MADLLPIAIEEDGGGDYTSLEAALDDNEQDLTSTDKYMVITIQGDWDNVDGTSASVDNYTTSATQYIEIKTAGDARHEGIYVAGTNYCLYEDFDWTTALSGDANFLTIDGLCIGSEDSLYNGSLCSFSCSNLVFKSNIIVKCVKRAGYEAQRGEGMRLTNGGAHIYNNVFYDCNTWCIYGGGYGSPIYYIYNNSIYDCGNGIAFASLSGDSNLTNNLVITNGVDYGENCEDGTFATNGSGDATGTAGLQSLVADTEWVTPGADMHLEASGSTSESAGTDLSGTFTTDYEGDTRTGDWDLGADQLVGAAPPAWLSVTQFMEG